MRVSVKDSARSDDGFALTRDDAAHGRAWLGAPAHPSSDRRTAELLLSNAGAGWLAQTTFAKLMRHGEKLLARLPLQYRALFPKCILADAHGTADAID